MNEKLQYATMLEIPVNTCNVTFKPAGKRKIRRKKSSAPEEIKRELLRKVNAETDKGLAETSISPEKLADNDEEDIETEITREQRHGKMRIGSFKFSAIAAELIIIGALIAVILLTNTFYSGSGINTFMNGVFGKTAQVAETIDERTYADFAPSVIEDGETAPVINNGVMTISATGSVYSPFDGKITGITADGSGKYTVEVAHSTRFKSVLIGLDYAYAAVGDSVLSNIPVGYCKAEQLQMCFKGADDALITDYTVVDGAVVWAA